MLRQYIEELKSELIHLRRQIHQNPELSNEEYKTRELILQELKELSIDYRLSEGSQGVVGILTGDMPGPTIALRADMDALPVNEESGLPFESQIEGRCHSCGHDIHTTVLLGCVKVLHRLKAQIKGRVVFIFQGAEEVLAGAQTILTEKLLDDLKIEGILALHTWPDLDAGKIGLKRGAFMASSDQVQLKIKGQAGHGAHPHRSIDAIVVAGYVICGLQTMLSREIAPLDPAVLSFGTIHGGQASNIIASEVVLEGTARALTPEVRDQIPKSVERIASHIAEGLRGKAEIIYARGTPPAINIDEWVDLVEEGAQKIIGSEQIAYLTSPSMGSEDFAFYLEKYPGCIFRLGTGNENPQSRLALHNPKIIFDEKAIEAGVQVMSQVVLNYLSS